MNSADTSELQRTLATCVDLHGPGMFHGIPARLRLLPADESTGIVFVRTDLADRPEVPARSEFVLNAARRTVLGLSDEPLVETVEHLMATLAGLGIDNCRVEIDAPEVPGFDGSSRVFCDAILDAGIDQQTTVARTLQITEPRVLAADGGQLIRIRPYLRRVPAITYQLDYGPKAFIAPQTYSIEVTPDSFARDIAAARTFVLESEITALQQMGYGKHLTEDNLLVLTEDGVRNNQLRWPDECVRHKILDCIGDFALSGTRYCGYIVACRSGHRLNHQLAGTLADFAGDVCRLALKAA